MQAGGRDGDVERWARSCPGDTATVSFTVSTSTTAAHLADAVHDLEHRDSAASTETPTPSDSNTVTNQLEVRPDDRQVGLGHRGRDRRTR